MLSRWILEDKDFIIKALGVDASKIIKEQQKKFEYKSLKSRIDFINMIYDLLDIK